MPMEIVEEQTQPQQDPQQAQQDETFELTEDGEVVKVTRDAVLQYANRGRSVLPKVQGERDKLQKEYEDLQLRSKGSLAFVEDFKAALLDEGEGGEEAVRRIGEAVGWTPEQMNYILDGQDEETVVDYDEVNDREVEVRRPVERRPEPQQMPPTITLDYLKNNGDPALRRMIETIESQQMGDMRSRLTNSVKEVLDADKNMIALKETTPRAHEALHRLATQELQRRVGAEGAIPGPQLYSEIADTILATAKDLGIRFDGPRLTDSDVAKMGLGGVADSLGEKLHRKEAPARVAVTDSSYKENLTERLAHKIREGGGIENYQDVPTLEDYE